MSGAKRILAALVAAAVLLMGTAALAEDTKINISAGEAGADGTITVTISLSGDTSVAGAQLALDYDETMLELVNVKNGAIVSGGISATNDEEPGSVIFIWSTLMGSKQPGELLKLTFRPKEGAHGSTEIKLDNALTETMIIDEELNELAYTEGSATLELASATNTPAPTAAPEQSAQPTQAPAATANPNADVTMDIGQNTTISGGSGTIWSSSNERVATVDQSGSVTAHAEGEAVIYAISEDGASVTETVVSVGSQQAAGAPEQQKQAPVQTDAAKTDAAQVTVAETEDDGPSVWMWLLFAAAVITGIASIYLAICAMRRR